MKIVQNAKNKLSKNLGFINLFGKSFGRVLLLILTAYLAKKLNTKDFAVFAIFWASLRMFTFYAANNLYIIYFNKVRSYLINKNQWPKEVSSNILITLISFSFIIIFVSNFIFKDLYVSIILVLCLFVSVLIRNLSEFAKSDNNLFLSIFIEDFLLFLLFFTTSIIGLLFNNSLIIVLLSLVFSLIVTLIVCLFLFRKKFKIKINSYKISLNDFSIENFKLGLNYTFLRANEVLCNFAARYLGQIYFGDTFVAYTHIMYQFYNVFNLLTMSVISGYQSKITTKNIEAFNKNFIVLMYKKLTKTIFPFVIIGLIILVLFGKNILELIFPKYANYDGLLIKVSIAGLIFAIIQPLVFILIYNNKFLNIRKLNYVQYSFMIIIFCFPYFLIDFNEEYWLLSIMSVLVIVQGLFAWITFNKIR